MSFKAPKKVLKDENSDANSLTRLVYEFGAFRVDPAEREIRKNDVLVSVTAKAFDTLLLLIQQRGHLLEKSEIMHAIWPDSFVEEGNLSVTVHMLRKALGDDSGEHIYIETVPKRGYRFIADVQEIKSGGSDVPADAFAQPDPVIIPVTKDRWSFAFRSGMAYLAAAVFVLVLYAMYSWHSSSAATRIQSLAVLPFRSFESGGAPDDVGVALADAISNRLAHSGRVIARPPTDLNRYSKSPNDPLTIGREQKVDAILSGRVERLADQLRLTVRLVRTSDGTLLWADTFVEPATRTYALQEKVEKGVARSMAIRLAKESKSDPVDEESRDGYAYKLYVEGRFFWNKRTEDGLRRSIEYFQQATTEDPKYALAYAGLADSYSLLGSYGVEPASQAYPNAKSAALKALELDDSLSEAHNSLGMIAFYYEWNWTRAEGEFQQSIELNPNYALAHMWYAIALAALKRDEEATAEIQRAQELDPVSLIINTEVGRVLYLTRHYDEAISAYKKVIDLEPQFARVHARLGMTYAAQGKYREAIQEFSIAQQLTGADPYLDGLLGFAHARLGNNLEARRFLERLSKRSQHEYVPAYSMALICVGLGERDRALELFARAYSDRSAYMVYAEADPLLDVVRDDPRFTSLLASMRFPTTHVANVSSQRSSGE
jgi:DNA-binding winged helix-turn-helix (wHTH) protein/tetratricopeptide (TPR) repeat protein/TolB-like protein